VTARFESLERRFTSLIEFRQDSQGPIESIRQEMLFLEQKLAAKINQANQEFSAQSDSLAQEMNLQCWMVAAVRTGMITMLIRSFCFHG
jgi:hypothetical protein